MISQSSVLSRRFSGRDEFVARVITRAWKDETYRKRLLQEPKTVLAEELGTAIPDNVEVRVVEETRNIRYIAIPYKRDNFMAVTDEELAGSEQPPPICPTNTSTAITSPCDCGR
ncbi:MAG: NHLP leader peptide family RiPP precursor [Streptosporangiaceae bacterium]|nr:NHLP leader peptide family RiPP precursor [Streptosporangiaceae bacterium]